MKHLDLFSGIGGFALATEQVWKDAEHIFCDNEPFAQAILKKHWPNAKIYGDIRQLTTNPDSEWELQSQGSLKEFREWVSDGVDLLTGGFPCQPFSAAGRRRGTEDDRHLWPEMLRLIRETNPSYVLGENVGGLLTWDGGLVFEMVCSDLEKEGYEVGAFVIPASAIGAPHRRDRVWITARNAKHIGFNGTQDGKGNSARINSDTQRENELRQSQGTNSLRKTLTDTERTRLERRQRDSSVRHRGLVGRDGSDERWSWNQNWHEVATRFCRMDDGIPRRLDRTPRLKALGNAIVPQVAEEILRAIAKI